MTCLHPGLNLCLHEPGDNDSIVFTVTVLTANFHPSSVIHSYAVKVIFFSMINIVHNIYIQKRSLRDLSGHSSTFILSDGGVQLGEIWVDSPGVAGGIQGGCPGSSA